jgi:hypothetical protein
MRTATSVAVGAAGTSAEHQDEPVFSAGSRLGWRIRSRARRISTSAEKRCSESNSSNTCVYVLQQVCGEWPACRATSAIDTPSLISGRRSCAAGHTDDLGQVAGLLPTGLPNGSPVLSTSSSALTSTSPRKMPGHQRSPTSKGPRFLTPQEARWQTPRPCTATFGRASPHRSRRRRGPARRRRI